MRKATRTLPILAALLLVALIAACSTPESTVEPADETTLSIEQILEKSQLAMNEVITYKTRGVTVSIDERRGNSEPQVTGNHYSEHHSYDCYIFGSSHPELDPTQFLDWLVIGSQTFHRNSDPVWQEQEPRAKPLTPTPLFTDLFSTNYYDSENEYRLISADEVTDEGVRVYRVGYTVDVQHNWGSVPPSGPTSERYKQSVLIDKETFRVVSRIGEKDYSREPGGSQGSTYWLMDSRTDYYDYNEPVVIEIPENYTTWQELAVLK